ncbi:hypothetical protein [Frondihabitans australicus]|uniref:Uncharacterized protein n=1 Tax=Frondihabitans australicus TaxID=386892 RepID=A0A495II65_9MICO|nr:hypothetical protein [Frondihabitans australicus]RKR74796.1 hypothetical protein C8E83_1926 [Frondihabitans australicus]
MAAKKSPLSKSLKRATSIRVTTEYNEPSHVDVSGLFLEIYDDQNRVLRADRVEYEPPRPLTLSEVMDATRSRLMQTMGLDVPQESFEFLAGGLILRALVTRVGRALK